MNMHRGIASKRLRGIFDNQVWTLNPVVGCDVLSRSAVRWTAPCKPGLIDVGRELGQARSCGALVYDAGPLSYHLDQHCASPAIHRRSFQPLGLDRFAVLT